MILSSDPPLPAAALKLECNIMIYAYYSENASLSMSTFGTINNFTEITEQSKSTLQMQ